MSVRFILILLNACSIRSLGLLPRLITRLNNCALRVPAYRQRSFPLSLSNGNVVVIVASDDWENLNIFLLFLFFSYMFLSILRSIFFFLLMRTYSGDITFRVCWRIFEVMMPRCISSRRSKDGQTFRILMLGWLGLEKCCWNVDKTCYPLFKNNLCETSQTSVKVPSIPLK